LAETVNCELDKLLPHPVGVKEGSSQGRSVFGGVGVAVALPPLNCRHFLGAAVQLPPQQNLHFEKLIGPGDQANNQHKNLSPHNVEQVLISTPKAAKRIMERPHSLPVFRRRENGEVCFVERNSFRFARKSGGKRNEFRSTGNRPLPASDIVKWAAKAERSPKLEI
jgi:hypothetical protein